MPKHHQDDSQPAYTIERRDVPEFRHKTSQPEVVAARTAQALRGRETSPRQPAVRPFSLSNHWIGKSLYAMCELIAS